MAGKNSKRQRARELYHFTCPYHLPAIFRSGRLLPTESNISAERTHAGPDVVWLTRRPMAQHVSSYDQERGAYWPETDKSRIRITVCVPPGEAQHWPKWSRDQGIAEWFYDALARAGGNDAPNWYVVARAIPQAEWLAIDDLATGEALWRPKRAA